MFEFLFTDAAACRLDGMERSRYTVNRLKTLAGIAAKLQQEGWLVWLTLTGLAFTPKLSQAPQTEEEQEAMAEEVEEELAKLGIWEEFDDCYAKTFDDLPDGFYFWLYDRDEAGE